MFWPLASLLLFAIFGVRRGLILSILIAYLILPAKTAFELPGIPPLNKSTIPSLAALFCALIFGSSKVLTAGRSTFIWILVIVHVVIPFATIVGNSAPVVLPGRVLPGMTVYDALSMTGARAIEVIPFVLAFSLFQNPADRVSASSIIVFAALLYSIPVLLEVRISPQLHRIVYGFHPSDFIQQMRGLSFRPVVLMGHGLQVALFYAVTVVMAVGLWRERRSVSRIPYMVPPVVLGVVLALCRTMGAGGLGAAFAFAVGILRPRRLIIIGALGSLLLLSYPALRTVGLAPTDVISNVASAFSNERKESFNFRVENEEKLLERAQLRTWTGWGIWGRARIYSKETGTDISVTDGAWIIRFGESGWIGYLATFGLFCSPLWVAFRERKRLRGLGPVDASLIAALTIYVVDCIPDNPMDPLAWLLAGTVAACVTSRSHVPLRSRISEADLEVLNEPAPTHSASFLSNGSVRPPPYR